MRGCVGGVKRGGQDGVRERERDAGRLLSPASLRFREAEGMWREPGGRCAGPPRKTRLRDALSRCAAAWPVYLRVSRALTLPSSLSDYFFYFLFIYYRLLFREKYK